MSFPQATFRGISAICLWAFIDEKDTWRVKTITETTPDVVLDLLQFKQEALDSAES